MIDVLTRFRAVVWALFVLTLISTAICAYLEVTSAYLASGFMNELLFFIAMLTESFGRLSEQRHKAWRMFARVILLLTGLAMLNTLFISLIALFSSR